MRWHVVLPAIAALGCADVGSTDGPEDCEATLDVFVDQDGDGFGVPDGASSACPGRVPDGFSAEVGDCDDTDGTVNPDAPERCDDVDNDCDGETDEDEAIGALTFYQDLDGDGFGDPDVRVLACSLRENLADNALDCDDDPRTGAASAPGLEEICNDGLDNDCDGTATGCGFASWDHASPDIAIQGTAARVGESVCAAGDLDGDGADDLFVGAPSADGVHEGSGRAVQFYGDPEGWRGPILRMIDVLPSWGATTGAGLGAVVSPAGDLDGDGLADVVATAPFEGRVYLIYGSETRNRGLVDAGAAGLPTWSVTAPPTSLAPVGDFTGDGLDDFLVGVAGDGQGLDQSRGSVFLVAGSSARASGDTALHDLASYHGAAAFDSLGGTARGVGGGDINGDGDADLVLGALGVSSRAGAAYLVFGSSTAPAGAQPISEVADVTLTGTVATQRVGSSLATVIGDLDQDGYEDLAIGDNEDNSAATVYVIFGTAAGPASGELVDRFDLTLTGPNNGAYFGYRNIAVGDFDNDDVLEVAVAAAGASVDDGDGNGAVYIFDPTEAVSVGSWRDVSTQRARDATHVVAGPTESPGWLLGMDLDAGDFNGDGVDDLVVGSPMADGAAGEAVVFLGGSL